MTGLVRLLDSLPWEGRRVVVALSSNDDGVSDLAIEREGQQLGSLSLSVRDDEVVVHSLVIDVPQRGYGAGSETAYLLLDHAEAAGFRSIRATAAPDLGLSVYFWTRMGLHPLHGEGACGGLTFVRSLQAASA